MDKNAYIFIGQSGSGKGTQVALLIEALQREGKGEALYLETGRRFRELIQQELYTAKKTKELMDKGVLPPPFLGIHAWTHFLIEEYNGESHVIMDGTPRVPAEVPVLLSAVRFYGWTPHVISLEVGDKWAQERMHGRGRSDDTDSEKVARRIEWYHGSVIPTIDLLKASPDVIFHAINGEQSIEAVHADICRALGVLTS